MRILAVHNYYQIRSGEDLAFDATIDAVRRQGHEVLCVTADNQALARGWSRFPRLAVLPLTTCFSVGAFLRVMAGAARFSPDVALVQNVFPILSPSVYVALRLMRIPVAQRLFNYRLVCTNGILYTSGEICERCVRGSYWNAVRYACYRGNRLQSAVLALSLRAWRSLRVWDWGVQVFLTPDRFLGHKVAPAMHDTSRLRVLFNPSLSREEAPIPLARPTRSREVLFVGRLVREKGIFTFVKCASQLPDAKFLVIGKGGQEDEARRLATALGLTNVRWLGPVYGEELLTLLGRAGALVLPSQWYDNMPLVLTQALQSGIPVVASRIDGIPEFIIDGETGRLAEPGDATSFAAAIGKVFDEPAETYRMAREGVRRANEWFGGDRFARDLEEILASILPGHVEEHELRG